ncbi:hypothetical protein D3C85_1582820 [compost metagenome]
MLELDEKRLYVMKQSPTTCTFAERLAEVHAQYADIHLVIEGEEWQGYAAASSSNTSVEDRLAESDYALFEKVEGGGAMRIAPLLLHMQSNPSFLKK